MASRDKIIASAEKLVAKGKIENAIKEYERLLDDNPNDVNTLNRIGDLWVRINRQDEAVRVFTRIADHYSRDGFFLKAIAIYKKINKLDPSRLDIYSSLAELYAKQGLAMEAKSQYLVLADYHLKQGDPRNALATYKKIAELDPNSINVHVKLADLYHQNNQTDEALKEYDRVGRLLLKRGMLDEAVQVFRKALKIDSQNVELVESLVGALLEARDHDNAVKLLEAALENNPDNAILVSLLGRAYIAKGDPAAAETVLEQAWASHPENPQLGETLAELALKQGAADRAFELLSPRIEELQKVGQGRKAIDLMNRILQVDSGFVPALEKTVAVYTALHEETNILASMNSLAEAHIANQAFEEAARVLEDLIRREPENSQHREKLAFVRQKMGSGAGEPASAAPATAAPEPSRVQPAPPPEPVESEDDFTLDLDSTPGLDLDLGMDTGPMAPPPPSDLTQPPSQPEPEEEEDLDFITEHMTEAEVFAKYGLTDKAVDHLTTVIDRSPRHLPAYERLFQLLLEEGVHSRIRDVGQRYISALRESGDLSTVELVENELAARGISLESPASTPPGAAAPEAPPEEGFDLGSPAEPPVEEIEFEIPIEPVGEEPEVEVEIEEPEETAEEEELRFDEETPLEVEQAPEEETFSFEPETPKEETVSFEPGSPEEESEEESFSFEPEVREKEELSFEPESSEEQSSPSNRRARRSRSFPWKKSSAARKSFHSKRRFRLRGRRPRSPFSESRPKLRPVRAPKISPRSISISSRSCSTMHSSGWSHCWRLRPTSRSCSCAGPASKRPETPYPRKFPNLSLLPRRSPRNPPPRQEPRGSPPPTSRTSCSRRSPMTTTSEPSSARRRTAAANPPHPERPVCSRTRTTSSTSPPNWKTNWVTEMRRFPSPKRNSPWRMSSASSRRVSSSSSTARTTTRTTTSESPTRRWD